MSSTIFNSREPACKHPFGAVKAGEPVTFTLRLGKLTASTQARLFLYPADCWNDAAVYPLAFMSSDAVYNYFSCEICVTQPGLCYYNFTLSDGDKTLFVNCGEHGVSVLEPNSGELWQLTVYDADFHTPEPFENGIIYQIFPDRFCRSGLPKENVPADRIFHGDPHELPAYLPDRDGVFRCNDYYGGDLKGIEGKLPYLAEMGVTAIYLNPIFEAHSNHRYNTADYNCIDPLLGTEQDFRDLCAAAKSLGMRIILDGVFSHTGSDSVYFNREGRYPMNGAYNTPDSPYRSWYKFHSYPGHYQSWWGFETLPEVNETTPDYQNFICGPGGVIEKWMRLGADGFRLDVADELPDETLDAVRGAVKAANPDGIVIGEVWEDASNKVSYGVRRRYLLGAQLDSVMNYPFKDAIIAYLRHGENIRFLDTVMGIVENYPQPVLNLLMNSLSTHDTPRILTALAGQPSGANGREWQAAHNMLSAEEYTLGIQLFKLAQLIQFTLPGIPSVYYGDEIGMYGYADPFNRCYYNWDSPDQDLLEFTKRLAAMRQKNKVFARGVFEPLLCTPELLLYLRRDDETSCLIALNRTANEQTILLPPEFHACELLFGYIEPTWELGPYGYAVLRQPL